MIFKVPSSPRCSMTLCLSLPGWAGSNVMRDEKCLGYKYKLHFTVFFQEPRQAGESCSDQVQANKKLLNESWSMLIYHYSFIAFIFCRGTMIFLWEEHISLEPWAQRTANTEVTAQTVLNTNYIFSLTGDQIASSSSGHFSLCLDEPSISSQLLALPFPWRVAKTAMFPAAYFGLAVTAASAVCHLQSIAPIFSFPVLRDFS